MKTCKSIFTRVGTKGNFLSNLYNDLRCKRKMKISHGMTQLKGSPFATRESILSKSIAPFSGWPLVAMSKKCFFYWSPLNSFSLLRHPTYTKHQMVSTTVFEFEKSPKAKFYSKSNFLWTNYIEFFLICKKNV